MGSWGKRVDLTNEVSIEQTTDKRFEILVLWKDGKTEQIPLKDMNLSTADVSKFWLNRKLRTGANTTIDLRFNSDNWIEFQAYA